MTAPFDEQFIDMMVPHHQGVVAMARVVLRRAEHPQIQHLAQSIIAAQDTEIAQMRSWRRAWYGNAVTPDMAHMPMLPPIGMGMMTAQSMMADIVRLKTAPPFDRAFIDAMLPHHQMAIAAARLELQYGQHAAALDIIASQARETGLMTAYRDVWYGGTPSPHIGM